jgi:hypothetical protein
MNGKLRALPCVKPIPHLQSKEHIHQQKKASADLGQLHKSDNMLCCYNKFSGKKHSMEI